MALYAPITGIITSIDAVESTGNSLSSGCSLMVGFMTEDQGFVNVALSGDNYVLNACQLNVGDRVTFFYDSEAPMTLIYPPQYSAVAAAHTPEGTTAYLGMFDQTLTSTDQKLTITMSGSTRMTLPNGQIFRGNLSDKLLLVLYSASTRSIPPQTTPEQIVVFCA